MMSPKGVCESLIKSVGNDISIAKVAANTTEAEDDITAENCDPTNNLYVVYSTATKGNGSNEPGTGSSNEPETDSSNGTGTETCVGDVCMTCPPGKEITLTNSNKYLCVGSDQTAECNEVSCVICDAGETAQCPAWGSCFCVKDGHPDLCNDSGECITCPAGSIPNCPTEEFCTCEQA